MITNNTRIKTFLFSLIAINSLILCQYQILSVQAADDTNITDSSQSHNTTNSFSAKESDAADQNSLNSSNNSSASPDNGKSSVLKGHVKGAAIITADGLKAILFDSKMLQHSATLVIQECTRKETVNLGQPNYIGNGIVIPAIGGPTGTMQMGNLPARKKKVVVFAQAIEEAFNALQNHIDALIIPEDATQEINNLYNGMRSIVQATRENINKMNILIEEPQIKTKEVGRAALHIYDSMTALEKIRSQLLELIKQHR